MRISTFQHASWTKQQMGTVQSKVAHHQNQVASGKKHLRISEEPFTAGKAFAVNHSIRNIEQMQKDIRDAKDMLTNTESSLNGMQQVLERTNVLALQALNGTNSMEDRQAVATEVRELVNQLIYLGNSQHDGRYLFGGSQTGNLPFAETGAYNGDGNEVSWDLNESYSVQVTRNGGALLGPAIATLQTMAAHLESGDIEGLRASTAANESNMNHIINARTAVGSVLSTLQSFDDILYEQKIGMEEHRSSLEDVDMMEAVSDLSHMNTTYQATLQAISMMNKVNILNYM